MVFARVNHIPVALVLYQGTAHLKHDIVQSSIMQEKLSQKSKAQALSSTSLKQGDSRAKLLNRHGAIF